MNKEEFINALKNLNIEIDEDKLNKLDIYCNFLKEYNEHTNLTAITEDKEIYLKHFYDSLTIVKEIDLNNINNLIDVGTGAGFPGMVIKIMYPHINVTLLDSNNKKTTFLLELINKLSLNNIKVVNARSEEYALNHLEFYDLVTSRAVANLRILTEICLPMVKVGGYFIPLKASVEEEIKESSNILNKLNGNIEHITTFNLPIEESLRNIVKIKKVGLTPKGYPRNYNKIKNSRN